MWFCPLDGTLLKVDREESTNRSTFLCTTCPYSCPIVQTQSVKTATKRKEVDDILGGAAAVSFHIIWIEQIDCDFFFSHQVC